jgi:hypothetical protein
VVGAGDILGGAGSTPGNNPVLARGEFIAPALSVANVLTQIGRAQITPQQTRRKTKIFYDETNRNLRTAGRTLQSRQRRNLVEQSAIDRCLWTTEDDVTFGITKEV